MELPDWADPKHIGETELNARLRVSVVFTMLRDECTKLGMKEKHQGLTEEERARLAQLKDFFAVYDSKYEEIEVNSIILEKENNDKS